MRSAVNQKELFEQTNYSLSLLGNGAAILLIVIGLINFVNVMLTGVVAKKNEFAIMESIGTTKKQIMKILTLEGGIYALQAINSTLTTSEWQLRSAVNQKELFEQTNYSLSLLGNGAAILLIVIGLINFVNVMLTGVVAKKNEFAIMESIGTTKKQIMKILTLEGGIYALISTLLIMTFGNAFLLLVADAVPHIASYAVFEYPVALVIGLIATIFVICLSVPAIVYKATSDETVIERLHNFEN